METVKKCRYHLTMFNCYRVVSLVLMASIVITLSLKMLGLNKSGWNHLIFWVILLIPFVLLVFSLTGLKTHARAFERKLGFTIERELLGNEQKQDIIGRQFQRYWTYLFYYYSVANESYMKLERIEKSA